MISININFDDSYHPIYPTETKALEGKGYHFTYLIRKEVYTYGISLLDYQ
jgi:hypothetical protein